MEEPVGVIPVTSFTGKYSFLSNFYPVKISWDGLLYPTLEHAYQATKTLDQGQRKMIQDIAAPGVAKRMGRNSARITLRDDWEQIKLKVMEDLLRKKFSPRYRIVLAGSLVRTYPAELIEGNVHGDRFWGMAEAEFGEGWVGYNHLGKLLMKIREEIRRK